MIKKLRVLIWKRKKSFFTLTVLAIVGGIVGVYSFGGTSAETSYVLAAVEKGTLVTSVSGSGQVWGEYQIDVNAEVSGKVTSVLVANNQTIEADTVIAELDSAKAQRTVRDAQASLTSAQLSLKELLEPADALSLLQTKNALAQSERTLAALEADEDELEDAENAVAQAERDLDKAQRSLEETNLNAAQNTSTASENGYNSVVEAFLDLPDVMNDLADLIGTEMNEEEYLGYYDLLVGSSYSDNLLDDYQDAEDAYNAANAAYLASDQASDDTAKITLIEETLIAAKAISDALTDASNMLSAIRAEDYAHSALAAHIDEMTSAISGDVTTVNQIVSSLQSAEDTIEETSLNSPYDVANAEDAVLSAQGSLEEKQTALEDLKEGPDADELAKAQEDVAEKTQQLADLEAGADEIEIATQRLKVQQAQDTLSDALEELADYTVRAPMAGTITGLDLLQGSTVSSGASIGTLVTTERVATITLNEIDAAKVALEQKVSLTFDAIEDLELSGHVVEVDTLGTVSQGVVSYEVTIAFDVQDERVKPGMTVSATILTEVKQDALLVPSGAVKSQGDVNYVQQLAEAATGKTQETVASATAPTQTVVEIGLSNDTQTEILSGLNEGDMVVTRTVTDSSAGSSSSSDRGAMGMFGGPM